MTTLTRKAILALAASTTLAVASTAACSTASEPPPPAAPAATPIELSPEIKELARRSAKQAVMWSNAETDEQRVSRYESAGMSPELAAEFEPIWVEIFVDDEIQTAGANGDPDGLPTTTSVDASQPLIVDVPVKYDLSWTINGTPRGTSPTTAVWTLTVDPTSEQVTAITQPDAATLGIEVDE